MEIIYINNLQNLENYYTHTPIAIALGNFDGLHLGHLKVINTCILEAKKWGYLPSVMTFSPHPSLVLGDKRNKVKLLYNNNQKLKVLKKLGLDRVYIIEFTKEFSALSQKEFIDQILLPLHVKHVVTGFDFTYGKNGKDTNDTFAQLSGDLVSYTVVPEYQYMDKKVSSTRIREAVEVEDYELAYHLLGRPYSSSGVVVKGDQRGRTIGYPTANVRVEENYVYPNTGVYIVQVEINGEKYNGFCNVGTRPTFHENEVIRIIEVHIFNFNQDIYGQEIEIYWLKKIRNEQKFSSIDELVDQLKKDEMVTFDYFSNVPIDSLDFLDIK